MQANEVLGALLTVTFTPEELTKAKKILNDRFTKTFRKGDRVSFFAREETWTGVVDKVNTKSISVKTTTPRVVNWRVSPQSLTMVN